MLSRNAHPQLLVPVLAVLLVGCTGTSAGLLKLGKAAPVAPQAPIVPAGNIIGNNTSTLVGVARVPSAQLIANHGAGLVSNHGAGLIGNNTAGLIGNNAGGFRVAHLADSLVPLAEALVTVTDAAGRPLTSERVVTDAQGRFTVSGVKSAAGPIFVRASRTQGAFTLTLLSIATATGGEVKVDLDPAGTLVAKKTARLLEAGEVKPETLNPAAIAAMAEQIEPVLTEKDLTAAVVLDEEGVEETFDAVLDSHPALKQAVGDVADAAQAPTPESPVPTPTATPRRSGGGGSRGGTAPPAPTATGETTIQLGGLHTLRRVAGDDVGGLTLGATPVTTGLGRVNGIALTPDGGFFVADGQHNQIRGLPMGDASVVVAGAADGTAGPAQSGIALNMARFRNPVGLAFDPARYLVVVCDSGNNRLRTFYPGSRINTIAGGGSSTGDSVGSATSARLDTPWGLAADEAGNLYFSERGNGRVRKLSRTGALTTLATLTPNAVGAVAVDPVSHCLWVADGDQVRAISDLNGTPTLLPDAVFTATGTSAGRQVTALVGDQNGLLYVLQTGTAPAGRVDTVLWRVAVDATGAARADRTPEAIAGTGGEGALAADYVAPTAPLPDARQQLLAAAGECGLWIDLSLGDAPDDRAGQIYLGHSFDDGTTRWGQVLRLEAAE